MQGINIELKSGFMVACGAWSRDRPESLATAARLVMHARLYISFG
jgi:hypothetical protein